MKYDNRAYYGDEVYLEPDQENQRIIDSFEGGSYERTHAEKIIESLRDHLSRIYDSFFYDEEYSGKFPKVKNIEDAQNELREQLTLLRISKLY